MARDLLRSHPELVAENVLLRQQLIVAARKHGVPAGSLLVDKAQLLTLSAPQLTVLVGGLRALSANAEQSKHGVFTKNADTLSNDFFVNLLDMSAEWKLMSDTRDVFEGRDRKTSEVEWNLTSCVAREIAQMRHLIAPPILRQPQG